MNSVGSSQLPSIDVFAYPAGKTYEQLQQEILQLKMALQNAQSREAQLVHSAKARIHELHLANNMLRSQFQEAEIENADLKMYATQMSLELARKDAMLEEVAAENLELQSHRQMDEDVLADTMEERIDCSTQTESDIESFVDSAEDTCSSEGYGAACDTSTSEGESAIYEPLTPSPPPSLEASNSSSYSQDSMDSSGFPCSDYFTILTLPEDSI